MKAKLLILDDEPLLLKSLEHLLEDDYEVFTSSDAATALRLAKQYEIAVILCDERMPGLSGHEFLKRVKEFSKATRVMMSGYADMNALTAAVNSGQIFAYIQKPWEPLQLKAQLAAAVVHFNLIEEIDQERGLLRALMENIPDPIYFKDRESRFIRVNQAHARALGAKEAGECVGKSDADYFESGAAHRSRMEEQEIVTSGRPQAARVEQRQSPRGALCWMSTSKVPMFDQSGAISGIASISRDITALKSSEELLWEQNEYNRTIIETAHDAFIAMDPGGVIMDWNPQAERTFGWAAAEIIGRYLCETVIPLESRDAHAHGVEHFLTTAKGSLMNRAIELVALHRDGHEFPVEATVWPVRVGGVCSFNAFVRDISERRRAEEARKKENTLIQLLQSVTVAANRSSSIEHTSLTCLKLIGSFVGWPLGHVYLRGKGLPDELISTKLWNAREGDRFEAFRKASAEPGSNQGAGLPGCVIASGKPEWVVNLAAQKPRSPRTRAALDAGLRSGFGFPIWVDEKLMGVLELFSTETAQPDEQFLAMMGPIGSQLGQVIKRQCAEQDLLQAKVSAESANLAKSAFLTTMSHEMRTPMNAILGMADLLSEGSLEDEQRRYVNIFQKAGGNLLELINDLLDLSKVESGHVDLESIGFDLFALLEKTIEMMHSRARDRGLQLTLELAPSVPLGLVGDPNRLRQILINLIGNALKFTERGSVTLRVDPDPERTGLLRFNVIDTGIGIAADKIEMIFDRFSQADSSTTRKYGGSGLGLAISKGLAELMGGRIGCTSEPGQGSTFFLSAPFEIRKGEASESMVTTAVAIPISSPAPQDAAVRILIAEDSEDNIVLVKAYLKESGFQLDFAENGQIAVDKTCSSHPDMVLMDLRMPVMDGLEATRAIRQWEAKTHARPVPILALTADASGEGVGSSLAAGCTEHLTKPIKKATLLAAISRHIRAKISITPPEGIEDLVPNYLLNVRRHMDEVLAGMDSKDYTIARRLGHDLKGSGQGYGFPEITRTGAAVEQAAVAANENEIRNQILALAAYLDRIEVVVT